MARPSSPTCFSLPSTFPLVFLCLQYEMVCTEVRSTVLQGSCSCLVGRGSAGHSSLRRPGSPLVVLRPFLQLPPVSPFFSFTDGFVLLLVVLAGLLPQFATIVIRFTETSLNLTTLQRSQVRYVLSQLSPSIFIGQSVTWSLVIQYSVGVFQVMQTYPISFITSGAFPFGQSTCVLSAFAH